MKPYWVPSLSEEIDKCVLLIWGVRTLRWPIITDETIKIENLHIDVDCSNKKMGPCATFSGIEVKIFDSSTLVYICLHSSSDTPALVHTRLVTCLQSFKVVSLVYTRLHLSTFVCYSSTFIYTCLHSSSDSCVFRIDTIFMHLATLFYTSL